MAHAPASIGPVINIPEAMRGTENASTPLDQRVPDRTTEMSAGPKIERTPGGTDSYLPSRYEQKRSQRDGDGVIREYTVIIEDR